MVKLIILFFLVFLLSEVSLSIASSIMTVIHTARLKKVDHFYADANVSISYLKEGNNYSYGVNVDAKYYQKLHTYGVKLQNSFKKYRKKCFLLGLESIHTSQVP